MDKTTVANVSVKEDAPAALFVYDVLEKVFANLSLKGLNRAMAVCKTWQFVANKEILRRNEIEVLVAPMLHIPKDDDYEEDDSSLKYLQNRWHISDSLRSLPDLALIFCDVEGPNSDGIDAIYLDYRWHTQSSIGCFESLAISMNDTEVIGRNNLGVVMTIPSTPRLKIDYYTPYDPTMAEFGETNTFSIFANVVINELLTSEEEHNCFLYFSYKSEDDIIVRHNRSFFTEFEKVLKKRCKHGTYSLWGGEISNIVTDICGRGRNDLVYFVALRLSGPAIKSWSIVLKLNLTGRESENVLLKFKKDIKLKTNTIAIAMVSSYRYESFKQRLAKTEVFRKIFSEIPLIGLYENNEFYQYGFNSMICDPDPVLQHTNSIAYLIITTD